MLVQSAGVSEAVATVMSRKARYMAASVPLQTIQCNLNRLRFPTIGCGLTHKCNKRSCAPCQVLLAGIQGPNHLCQHDSDL